MGRLEAGLGLMSNTIAVTLDGETRTLRRWCALKNLKYRSVWSRMRTYGWPAERALSTPARSFRDPLTLDGETLTIKQWCRRNNFSYSTALRRLHAGWRPEFAVSVPAKGRKLTAAERETYIGLS